MVPIMTYASTTLYPCPDPRRAGAAPSWVAVGRRLHPAPLPDLVGQRRRPKAPAHRRQRGRRGGHRPQRHPRLPRRGAPLPGGEVLPAQDRPAAARPGPPRRAVPAAAPEPPPGRPAAQHLDAGPGRAGLLRARLDPSAAQRRGGPPRRRPPGRPPAAGPTPAPPPRPGVRGKKKARDRLIRLAQAHPEWVLGYQDETWWSRLAQPDLHAWAGPQPLRLCQLERPAGDNDPKALSCYGLLRADTG